MKNKYANVLQVAGYTDSKPTKENVIDCFLDYVDCNSFSGLEVDAAKEMIEDGEITMDQICYNMLRICKYSG